MNFLEQYVKDLHVAIDALDLSRVEQAINLMRRTRDVGGHIFTCGNGGSASTASHFACDVLKGASYQREKKYRVIALTDFMPTISAYANDVGYEHIFVEPLRNLAKKGDVLLAISGSGNSPNVLQAVKHAKEIGCQTIGLTGRDGGKLGNAVDLNVHVADPHMGRIEDAHLIVCHMIAYKLMEPD